MRVIIAIPCMDTVHTQFCASCLSLEAPKGTEIHFQFAQGSLIYNSRNELGRIAMQDGFDRILWLDSDMVFKPDLLRDLSAIMDARADIEYVSALCFTRKLPVRPTIYKDVYMGKDEKGQDLPVAESYTDYPRNSLAEVAASGMAAVLMTTDMLKAVAVKYGLPFSPRLGFGEDLSFCMMAREMGYKLYAHTGIKVGHIGQNVITEDVYTAMNQFGGGSNGAG